MKKIIEPGDVIAALADALRGRFGEDALAVAIYQSEQPGALQVTCWSAIIERLRAD